MPKCLFLAIVLVILGGGIAGQNSKIVSVNATKQNINAMPGDVVNVPLFIKNTSTDSVAVRLRVINPQGWRLISNIELDYLKPLEQKFIVISTRIPALCLPESYVLGVELKTETGELLSEGLTRVRVEEVEKIALEQLESADNVKAGETYTGHYLLKNLGNSEKTVFIKTLNCDVDGNVNVVLKPGESSKISVVKHTSEEIGTTRKDYIKVYAMLGGEIKSSASSSLLIFPVKTIKKDMFFRYPVNAKVSYLAAYTDQEYSSAYQVDFSGKGPLDPAGKHRFEFIARGPNNSGISYFGDYDQYFAGYSNKNLEVRVGQNSYQFTPLTESSRYGFGVENKVILNNGLSAGFIYVTPRYVAGVERDMAVYTQFEKNKNTTLALYVIQKDYTASSEPAYLFSVSSAFKPIKSTSLEFEFSHGFKGDEAGNAYKINVSSRLSVFSINGVYYNVGENYPGYYSNSKFYSGSLAARLSKKINVGMSARRDFSNAELDTFYVTAPYTESLQYYLNYTISRRANLRIYWRDYERKDRLSEESYHYNTRSVNSQFTHKLNRLSYSLKGEYGKTTNYLLSELSGKQNTWQAYANTRFKFSNSISVTAFGSYSNLNSYLSDDERNATTGLSITAQVRAKLRASLRVQNAYDIEESYRERNLMQFNVDYKMAKNHELSFHSYYTLYRNQTEDPDVFISASYNYKFGVPLKRVVKAGDFTGRLTVDSGEPKEGVLLTLLNKTAITNAKGEFEFRTLPPGVYMLHIDRSKFAIDEMPVLPSPIKIEIIEDQETNLNIGITQGAKLKGKFVVKPSETNGLPAEEKPEIGNIIIELSNDLEKFRIATEQDGSFSFPLVLPGTWSFKIYENTLPKGYLLDQKDYSFLFKPGELMDFNIDLKQKKRKIIFKSQGLSLSNSGLGGLKPLSKANTIVSSKTADKSETIFYTVQIGTFSERKAASSSFFKGKSFDMERQINNLYKYFIGRFSSQSEAREMKEELANDFEGAFVVAFKNDKLIYINDQNTKR